GQFLLSYLCPQLVDPEQAAGPAASASTEPVLDPRTARDLELAVRSTDAQLGVRVRNWPPAGPQPGQRLALDCELLYLEGSPASMNDLTYLEGLCAAANIRFLEYRLQGLVRPP